MSSSSRAGAARAYRPVRRDGGRGSHRGRGRLLRGRRASARHLAADRRRRVVAHPRRRGGPAQRGRSRTWIPGASSPTAGHGPARTGWRTSSWRSATAWARGARPALSFLFGGFTVLAFWILWRAIALRVPQIGWASRIVWLSVGLVLAGPVMGVRVQVLDLLLATAVLWVLWRYLVDPRRRWLVGLAAHHGRCGPTFTPAGCWSSCWAAPSWSARSWTELCDASLAGQPPLSWGAASRPGGGAARERRRLASTRMGSPSTAIRSTRWGSRR